MTYGKNLVHSTSWRVPSKPGKIRVVFDCSAEFEGRSINQELFSGPDLTNQIAGILTRFLQEPVAFMSWYQIINNHF